MLVMVAVVLSAFVDWKDLLNPPDAPRFIVKEINPESRVYLLPAKFERN